MSCRRRAPLWLSVLVAVAPAGGAAAAPPVPLSAFFDYPAVSDPVISPDGTRVAYIGPYRGHTAVALYTIGKGEPEVAEAPTDGNVNYLLWKGNDRLLYDGVFDQAETAMLACLDFSRHNVTRLMKTRSTGVWILDPRNDDPNHIALAGYFSDGQVGVSSLDIRSGHGDVLWSQDAGLDHADAWVLDRTGALRLEGRLLNRGASSKTAAWFAVTQASSEAEKLYEAPLGQDTWFPMFFDRDGHTLYVVSYETSDTGELRTYDCTTRQMGPVLFHDDQGEIDDVILDNQDHVLGVHYTTDRPRVHWFDRQMRGIQAGIDAALPDTSNDLVSFDDRRRRFVVSAWSDRQPPIYYLLDTDKGTLTPIGQSRPGIRTADMRATEPISFAARDGLLLHGYLTRPQGAEGHPGPMVVLVHGGPEARDVWGFDPEVQFLANRGYAVLQVNYRGSAGYGRKFRDAGIGQWGRKMQDDITDGVRWALAHGVADPRRIAIYGASFGGYATLIALEFTPGLFRCGVNLAGPTDLAQEAFELPSASAFYRYYARIRMGGDKTTLARYSPVNFVQNISVPTLHGYGDRDPRVDIHQWRALKRELDRYHKPYTYVELPYEGHGFRLAADQIKFHRAVEEFLQRNL